MIDTLGFSVLERDLDALAEIAMGLPENAEVVEIGSGVGVSAGVLSAFGATVHCIDTWSGTSQDKVCGLYEANSPRRVFEAFCKNAGDKLFSRVFPHVGTSALYASVWPRKVDLVFIDGAHDYHSVKQDIKAWAPMVKGGGILCGHDYAVLRHPDRKEMFPGVRLAVDEIGPDGVSGSVWWKRL